MAIYLKLKKKPKTIDELIVELFSIYSISTRYLKATKTYKDPECKINQCCTGRYRSIDDFFEIVKTYFPKATEEEILYSLLHKVIRKHNKYYVLYCINCSTINKSTIIFIESISLFTDPPYFYSYMMSNTNSHFIWNKIWKSFKLNTAHKIINFQKSLIENATKKQCKIIKNNNYE